MAIAAPIRAAIPQRTRWPLTELSDSFDFERPFQPDIFRRTPHHQIVCARSYHEFLRLLVIEREAGSRQAERNGLLLFRLQSDSLEDGQFLGSPFHAGLDFVDVQLPPLAAGARAGIPHVEADRHFAEKTKKFVVRPGAY